MLVASFRQSRAASRARRQELESHKLFAASSRALRRVVVLVSHCPQRADSAKLAHVCGSGSSGGHHPSPDDRPTSCSTRRPISLGGLRCGRQFHCRPSLRRPGLSMPRVTCVLGTRSPPWASYLAQCAQLQRMGLAVPCSRQMNSRFVVLCCMISTRFVAPSSSIPGKTLGRGS